MNPIWQLFNPRAPDEIYEPDSSSSQIANNRLDTINKNANHDHNQLMVERIRIAGEETRSAREETQSAHSVATLVAADRLALHRTLEFIEKRWKEGADVEKAFVEAEDVRQQEFDNIVADKELVQKIKGGVKKIKPRIDEGRRVLVEGLPVRRNAIPQNYRPGGPKRP